MAKGSIEKRGTYSWRLRVDLGFHPDGTRNRSPKTIKLDDPAQVDDPALMQSLMKMSEKCIGYKDAGRKLREYLDDELAAFKREVLSGEYITPEKMTFEAFEVEWDQNYASDEKNLSPTTYNAYKAHLRNHIIPVFGKMQINHIKPLKIVNFLKSLEQPGKRINGKKEPLTSGTIEVIYRTLRNVFNRAMDWKIIQRNPMDGVKKPKVEHKKMEYYDELEAREAIQALSQEPLMWRIYIITAMVGGLRRGEILALQWTDVDYEENSIFIENNIPLTRKGEAFIKDPKTTSSKASVEMPEWYMNMLKAYEHEWKETFFEHQKMWHKDSKFIFHSGLGKPIYYTYPTEWWKKCCKRHGLKYITIQNLRHSCATLLLEENVPMKKIQERLRHSRYETTANIYTHVTKRGKSETASTFNKFDVK